MESVKSPLAMRWILFLKMTVTKFTVHLPNISRDYAPAPFLGVTLLLILKLVDTNMNHSVNLIFRMILQ